MEAKKFLVNPPKNSQPGQFQEVLASLQSV